MTNGIQTRAVAGTFWAYVQNWSARALTLVTFFALGRLLGPGEFGIFAIVAVLLMLAELLVEQGLSHAIVQREKLEDEHLNASFWTALFIGVACTLVSVVVAGPVSTWFGHEEIGRIFVAVSPVFLFMSLACVPSALLRRELQYKALAKRAALSNTLSGLVAIVMAASGAGVWTFVGQQLTFHLVGMLVLWHYESWRPACRFSISHLRELGGFSAGITLAKLMELAETKIVDLAVGSSLGVAALGSYSLAVRANQALTQVIAAPLWEVAISTFSRLQADRPACQAAYLRMTEFSSFVAIPVILLSVAIAPQLIPAVFGPQWHASITAFQLLGLLAIIRTLLMLNGCLFQASGMAGTSLLISAIRLAITLASLWLLLRFGIEGAACALMTAQLVVLPISYRILQKEMQISVVKVLGIIVRPLFSALIGMGFAVWGNALLGHRIPGIMATLLSMGLGLVSFLLLIGVLAPATLSAQLMLLPGAIAKPVATLLNRLGRAK